MKEKEQVKEASEWVRENLREFVYDMYAVREREDEIRWRQSERERERGT